MFNLSYRAKYIGSKAAIVHLHIHVLEADLLQRFRPRTLVQAAPSAIPKADAQRASQGGNRGRRTQRPRPCPQGALVGEPPKPNWRAPVSGTGSKAVAIYDLFSPLMIAFSTSLWAHVRIVR